MNLMHFFVSVSAPFPPLYILFIIAMYYDRALEFELANLLAAGLRRSHPVSRAL